MGWVGLKDGWVVGLKDGWVVEYLCLGWVGWIYNLLNTEVKDIRDRDCRIRYREIHCTS